MDDIARIAVDIVFDACPVVFEHDVLLEQGFPCVFQRDLEQIGTG